MPRPDLPSTSLLREEESQVAMLRDAADVEALRAAYRAVITASAHSVFADRILPEEAKKPSEPLLSAYQAAVAAFADSVFRSTGTPVEVGQPLTNSEQPVHPVLQPVTQPLPLCYEAVDIPLIAGPAEEMQPPTLVPEISAQKNELDFQFSIKAMDTEIEAPSQSIPGPELVLSSNTSPDTLEVEYSNALHLASVAPETIETKKVATEEIVTEEVATVSIPDASSTVSQKESSIVQQRLKVRLRRELEPVKMPPTNGPTEPPENIPGFRPAYRNALSQPVTSNIVSSQPDISPDVNENPTPPSVTDVPILKTPDGPSGDSPEKCQPSASQPTTRLAGPPVSLYAFHDSSAWSVPFSRQAECSVECQQVESQPVESQETPPILSVPEAPVEPIPEISALPSAEIPQPMETHAENDPHPTFLKGPPIQQDEPTTESVLDFSIPTPESDIESSIEGPLEDLPVSPESWLVKTLSRPRLVAGLAGFCLVFSAVYAMLSYWWMNGASNTQNTNIAEASEPIGMLSVQETAAPSERTTGTFSNLQQLREHPPQSESEIRRKPVIPGGGVQPGALLAQARPTQAIRYAPQVAEPNGRPDPFAPLLRETDAGTGEASGNPAAPSAPKDVLRNVQYTGFIGDIASREKVAIIKVQDELAGVTRTLIKKVGETFLIEGERVMLQSIGRDTLAVSVAGRSRDLMLNPYTELASSSNANNGGNASSGSTAGTSRRNATQLQLEEPAQ